VCIATSGPGATNLITGVACAYDNSIPMLVITGQPPIHSFGKNAPVIAVSANASGTDKARCLAAGADAFIAKPIDRASLLQLVGERLSLNWEWDSPH